METKYDPSLNALLDAACDVCTCGCHRGTGLRHFAPCCIHCPRCGERIRMESVTGHYDRCPAHQGVMGGEAD